MIPAWNLHGVIPPIRPGMLGSHSDRSPYQSSLASLIHAMGTSSARLDMLEGLLNFRSKIHDVGGSGGFQWLNGSFSENVEAVEGRAPRDVDVITFISLPPGQDEASFVEGNSLLFDHAYIRDTFRVDAY